jgi:hypothetical protein
MAEELRSPENRQLVIAVLTALAIGFADVATNHEPTPHNLPIVVLGAYALIGFVAAIVITRLKAAAAGRARAQPA